MALVTSMAAQASISLEARQLFEELDRQKRRFEAVFRALPVERTRRATTRSAATVTGNPAAAALFNYRRRRQLLAVRVARGDGPSGTASATAERSAADELPLVAGGQRGHGGPR